MMTTLAFAVLALVMGVSAIAVVRTRDLIRAVLWLALGLVATAVLYAQLEAPFLAGVQVLTYVGGIVTLMIFGVMVTHGAGGGPNAPPTSETHADRGRGAVVAGGFFFALATAIWQTDFGTPKEVASTTGQLAHALLDDHLVAFEAASLLLLAAIVGAVVLARKRDPVPGEAPKSSLLNAIAASRAE